MKYLIGFLVLVEIYSWSPLGRDNSDSQTWGARSGVNITTDALTGCQYLRTSFVGIAPRLEASGRQVGCRVK